VAAFRRLSPLVIDTETFHEVGAGVATVAATTAGERHWILVLVWRDGGWLVADTQASQ
jgi:hypothetical protein